MTFDERVQAVAKKGFSDCQLRFLTTVMLQAGVCVPRQYARYCGIVYSEKRGGSSRSSCGASTPRCTTAATTERASITSINVLSTQLLAAKHVRRDGGQRRQA